MVGAPDYKNKYNKFNKYYTTQNNAILSTDDFSYYLAGLWEGDGHVWIPKTTYAPSGKRYTPHFSLSFDKRDINLCLRLKEILGGTVSDKSINSVNACTLTIVSKEGLLKVVFLLNGKLRTPKVVHFGNLITWINSKYSTNIEIRPSDTTSILNNAWLSGFIDADGSFGLHIRKKSSDGKGKNRIESRFRLEQRKIDCKTNLSYLPIIDTIATTFMVNLQISKHNEGKEYYNISITSPVKLIKLVKYLERYCLFSSKRINFFDFQKSVSIILKKEHILFPEKFVTIKDEINNKRTKFCWNHLQDLKL